MKTFYALETKFMNGTVNILSQISLFEDFALAKKVEKAVQEANTDVEFGCVTNITEVVLFEDETEVPILSTKNL